MKYDYHLIVLGAGSGGLVAASGAAALGAQVALVESGKMGGDCLNYGCVPSKTLLKSAHVSDMIHRSRDYGISTENSQVDMDKVIKRVSHVIKAIEPHDSKERFEGLGVDVYEGHGTFVDEHRITVGDKVLSGKNIVIATGSEPAVPSIPGLKDVSYYTNKTIFSIDTLPDKLIVLGAGPIGCELGQAFSHMGSKVTMVDIAKNLFQKDDMEVGPLMMQRFMLDGIALELGAAIISVEENQGEISVVIQRNDEQTVLKGDSLLVALGRIPNTAGLEVDKAGVKLTERGHVATNDRLQTNVSHIYACGDVTGPYAFTHMAGYQAGIVIQNMIFPVKKNVDYRKISWSTYTLPEVAHVGYTEQQLIEKGIDYKKYLENLGTNDRAKAEGDTTGFLKILTDSRGIVIGATMVGEKAGEQIALANMAVVKKMKLSSFMSMIFPYPTESEIYKTVALQALKESFKPWKQELVKRLFLS